MLISQQPKSILLHVTFLSFAATQLFVFIFDGLNHGMQITFITKLCPINIILLRGHWEDSTLALRRVYG